MGPPDAVGSDASDRAFLIGAAAHVVIVHYRSSGMISSLLSDLHRQGDVQLDVHVVECGPDGSVEEAAQSFEFTLHDPQENLGYCGGNNLVFNLLRPTTTPTLVVNPDVALPDPLVVRRLLN